MGAVEHDGQKHAGVLRLHNLYVAYRLPLTVEVQWFEWLPGFDGLGASS